MRGGEDRARVVAGEGGGLKPGQAFVLLPVKDRETENSPAAYLAPLRTALIEETRRHVNIVVCETDYQALKRGIENLQPGVQLGRKNGAFAMCSDASVSKTLARA